MMQIKKAIVTDDHPLMAQATKELLEQIEGVEVVGIASNGQSCLELVERYRPDLVFLDYQLPDHMGTDIAAQIKASYPKTHIVFFTGVDVSALTDVFLELQVSGVISKGTRHATIQHVIGCILDDYIVMPRSVLQTFKGSAVPSTAELTDEEVLIMMLIIKGTTLEQIAAQIHISKRSVDNYQRKIYGKLGVKTRVEAIEAFIRSKYYKDGRDDL
ncbi:response regulator transcription factor [Paenibacillus sp. FSL H7-0331]|jgi:two-component system competent response regulator ComA|uniref:response regulator transcription factor n=1 Tax=Paenibacillus sp. FSL H7-0331 TaxID=1920421 RepID=UPI00096C091C|nr:response regulator transcription factor [Paenibacillus sp. FSL H7-0331]OMF18197.1 two-component system response regulator [Paenibacillus sp. FSL H7-0331]